MFVVPAKDEVMTYYCWVPISSYAEMGFQGWGDTLYCMANTLHRKQFKYTNKRTIICGGLLISKMYDFSHALARRSLEGILARGNWFRVRHQDLKPPQFTIQIANLACCRMGQRQSVHTVLLKGVMSWPKVSSLVFILKPTKAYKWTRYPAQMEP